MLLPLPATWTTAKYSLGKRAYVRLFECLLQTIHELQGVRQQLSHVTDTATASKVLRRMEHKLKSQTQVG